VLEFEATTISTAMEPTITTFLEHQQQETSLVEEEEAANEEEEQKTEGIGQLEEAQPLAGGADTGQQI
jgi:hypothetical protein